MTTKHFLLTVLLTLTLPTIVMADDYPINYDKTSAVRHATRRLNAISLAGATVSIPDNSLIYNDITGKSFFVYAGETITPAFDFSSNWMHGYAYIDYNGNKQFDVSEPNADGTLQEGNELVSYTYYSIEGAGKNSNGTSVSPNVILSMPSFTIPADLAPGTYKMRFKVDWNCIDAGGSTVAGNDILRNGGAIADIDLVVLGSKPKSITITDVTTEGGSVKYFDGSAMTEGVLHPFFTPATFLLAANEGYKPVGLKVANEDGEETFSATNLNIFDIAGSLFRTNTTVTGLFEPVAEGELEEVERWKLVFNDEFNQADYSKTDDGKWIMTTRSPGVTWKRFVSNSDSVAYIKDGALVLRTIPNPDTSVDDAAMLSGARQSNFDFKYGRAEARLKSTKHKGNFPAFWMMPTNTTGGWPACGEIDIMETIDSEDRAYFTIHSKWGNTLGQSGNPPKTNNKWVSVEDWHIYAIEWDSLELRWYMDNEKVFTYPKKITSPNALENGQWPFDKAFYLIINQSVGNGSWAAAADEAFTYETRVDWIRVYQKTPAVRAAYDEFMKYPTYFYRDQAVTHATRRLNSISLNDQTIDIPDNTRLYNRINSTITFTAAAGDTVKPSFNFSEDWMHGYVYMDLDNNGLFNVLQPIDGVIAEGTDLMSFSYYDGYNSSGEALSDNNTMETPSFIIPEDLQPGTYQMRYKVDWNNYNPAGSIAEEDDILTNGGAFADIKIVITDGASTGINAMTREDKVAGRNTYYDLSGRKVCKPQNGIYIKNGKKYFIS